MPAFPVTVFSDFACPYSYVVESALRSLDLEDVEIAYRAYELFPEPAELPPLDYPLEEGGSLARLADFQGVRLDGATERPRTRKAHEAARFGRERGMEGALRDRIFAALWGDGRDIGRIDVLMELATESGAEPEDLKIALDIDRYRDDVLRDEELARRLRVPGTPTLFLGTGSGARVITGAHGAAVLRTSIEEASREWREKADDV